MPLRDLMRRKDPPRTRRDDARLWDAGADGQAWRRPTDDVKPARWKARTDFFGVDLDGSQVPDAIAIRSTALDEGRARDLRRANAFRSAEGRPTWQVSVYEAAFAAAWSGAVTAEDDAALAGFERLYPDTDAALMVRAHGGDERFEPDQAALRHIPDFAARHRGGARTATWGGITLADDVRDVGFQDAASAGAVGERVMVPEYLVDDSQPAPGPLDAALAISPSPSLGERERAEADAIALRAGAALSDLRRRKATERREAIARGVLAAIQPDIVRLLAEGAAPCEIEVASSEGGFDLPEGWLGDIDDQATAVPNDAPVPKPA